ncbi:aspartate aminotransferase family protein [Neoehrlichia mikurensis]|uniref:Aspartate aminotransferase family protein n=1 Tax=Neoehrlichia mikurensis TaxID=89586 RepID=A0A9Q9BWD7_9RICK|nr:aspartate aminotransferase family protein [Neoehrlichia mikurensis]QXK92582.1 aspartate aminotransferase family protein [Neoehrlichia mikurensis]QXK93819.1 aspartate aminotransferase family protein [Neoehrlichia mikurensis]UTO55186.1 aspartate aminotransferase family protein [Neoehrlichia mikurensis]UTO56106.1 aspartate aminotransferase family protein [Neoehrlichia mikurensis]
MLSSPIMPFYNPQDLSFTHGKGVCLYDKNGNRYLDFISGIGVNSLGYSHPALINALKTQGEKIWHASNLYVIPEAIKLAQKLIDHSFADTIFFTNSGAEAVECGLKVARSYHNGKKKPERYKILTLKNSFHGRTYAACSASDPQKFSFLLYPYVDWFINTDCNINIIKDVISKHNIGTILLEPIQGEGGINVIDINLLKELRTLCNEHDILLFFDCVQCGTGRTGKFFAYEHFDIQPDICSLAKGIGGGFPLGSCLATANAAQFLSTGIHGSTYGGNPLATTIGYTVVNEILSKDFLNNVTNNGIYLKNKLVHLSNQIPIIEEVKGMGLMLGIKIQDKISNTFVMRKLTKYKLLVGTASNNVIRMLPPLIISQQEIDEAVDILKTCFTEITHN